MLTNGRFVAGIVGIFNVYLVAIVTAAFVAYLVIPTAVLRALNSH